MVPPPCQLACNLNFASQSMIAMLVSDAVQEGTAMREITPQSEDRADDPDWQTNFAALKESLRSKRDSNDRVGVITEDDKYGNETTPLDGLRRF
jgi:hypothetical protein